MTARLVYRLYDSLDGLQNILWTAAPITEQGSDCPYAYHATLTTFVLNVNYLTAALLKYLYLTASVVIALIFLI